MVPAAERLGGENLCGCGRGSVGSRDPVSEFFFSEAANLCGTAVSSVFLAQHSFAFVFILMLLIYHPPH